MSQSVTNAGGVFGLSRGSYWKAYCNGIVAMGSDNVAKFQKHCMYTRTFFH